MLAVNKYQFYTGGIYPMHISEILSTDVKFSVFADWWFESYGEINLKESSIERYAEFRA